MEKDKHKTKVIFRVFRGNGDVIALFPELPGTNDLATCMSYQRVGQHGAAHLIRLIQSTRAATPAEAAPLARELEGLGYNLKAMQRFTGGDYKARRSAVFAPRDARLAVPDPAKAQHNLGLYKGQPE